MQKSNWLRIGLVGFATMVGGSSALIACSSDDDVDGTGDGGTSSSSSSSGSSSGLGGSSGASGGSSGASSSSGDSGPKATPAALAVVHGYNDLGPVRICYAIDQNAVPEKGKNIATIAPLPDTAAGLIPGSGGILPSTGLALSQYNIQAYLIKSNKIATGAQCQEVIGDSATASPALVEGTDYFALAPIPKGALVDEHTFVLIAREDPANKGVPTAVLFPLDTTTTVAADKIGVQFIHGDDYLAAVGSNVAPFIDRPATGDQPPLGDAGLLDSGANSRSMEFLVASSNATKIAPFSAITNLKVTDAFVPVEQTAFGVEAGDANIQLLNTQQAGGLGALIPVTTWAALSDPAGQQGQGADSLYFKAGGSFTFIALGNPGEAQPTSPTDYPAIYKRPHLLVFPNKPVVGAL